MMQQQHNSKPALADPKSISFDDASKFFGLPISYAAEALGVCTNVLKKVCHDNGLLRWPYRKSLGGKSIEEIKKDAARERNKQFSELSEVPGERDNLLSCSTPSSLNELPSKRTSLVQENPKPRALTHQENKNVEDGIAPNIIASNLTREISNSLDEFKHGFPSNGLSTASYGWWGSRNSDVNEDTIKDGRKDVDNNNLSLESRDDTTSPISTDLEKSDLEKSNIGPYGPASLSTIRKRAVNEQQAALRLGVCRGSSLNKLGRRQRLLLLRMFKSSWPNK